MHSPTLCIISRVAPDSCSPTHPDDRAASAEAPEPPIPSRYSMESPIHSLNDSTLHAYAHICILSKFDTSSPSHGTRDAPHVVEAPLRQAAACSPIWCSEG